MENLKDWENDGKVISKKFKFKNFEESLEFVNKVGEIAEVANHHPDIEFGWGYANITFTTHDAGGLTEKDYNTAAEVDKI